MGTILNLNQRPGWTLTSLGLASWSSQTTPSPNNHWAPISSGSVVQRGSMQFCMASDTVPMCSHYLEVIWVHWERCTCHWWCQACWGWRLMPPRSSPNQFDLGRVWGLGVWFRDWFRAPLDFRPQSRLSRSLPIPNSNRYANYVNIKYSKVNFSLQYLCSVGVDF